MLMMACSSNDQQRSGSSAITEVNATTVLDEYTASKPNEAVVKHLDLNIKVDFGKRVITGVASYQIDNKKDVEKIILDSRDLDIEKVTLDNGDEETDFEIKELRPFMGNSLTIYIKPTTTQINIHYSTNPQAAAVQWLDPVQTGGKKHPFMFTQSQSILARTWVPCQDGPGIRITYNAEVKVPVGLMAVMSAENPKKSNPAGRYFFKMEQPIPSYLLALAVGELSFMEIGKRTGVYAEPSVIEKAFYELEEMEDMLFTAERMYGPYSWDRYDVIILPPSFPFGGMENPRLTFATPTILAGDRSLTSLIAHEMAHSWSGNLVTNSTWNDFWLNEGFTVYFERRIMEEHYGRSYSEMLALLGYQDLESEVEALGANNKDTWLKGQLDGRDPDVLMTDIPYEKGYFFLRLIEETVGRKTWDLFLRKYFATYAFQTMTTEQFVVYMKEELFSDKEELLAKIDIDKWLYAGGIPENCPKVESARFALVDKVLAEWQDGTSPAQLNTKEWTTHEWLHFLRQLPEDLTVDQMIALDDTFHFTQSGNSEIVCVWLEHSVNNEYEIAYDSLEQFLVNVGRRKFLTPLYSALVKTEKGKKMAKDIYAKARPNYHSVSTGTIDEIVGFN
ncbi:MAG: M1 family metallopeptidase [Bacteroidia bacterium]|nr:M1 family metallopeptidase [Bacteroidia bacterium]